MNSILFSYMYLPHISAARITNYGMDFRKIIIDDAFLSDKV